MRVHIHGNCQAWVLASMFEEVFPDWRVSFFEVHAEPIITHNDAYQDAIRTSDIILAQPIHDGYRGRSDLSLAWVQEAARPDARVIVIPAMYFEGHHPGFCGLTDLGDFCWDATAAHLIAAGVPPGRALEMMLSTELYTETFVRSEIARSMAEMARREREDGIAIRLSAFEEHFTRARQAFHIVNHPTRPPYAYVLNQVLDRLGIDGPRAASEGHDYQTLPHVPMSPSVAFHCANLFAADAETMASNDPFVRLPGQPPLTQREYFTRMLGQLSSHGASEIGACLRGVWQAAPFLGRLATADPKFPGIEIWAEGWTPNARAASKSRSRPEPSVIRHRGQGTLGKSDSEVLDDLAADAERDQQWRLVIALARHAISLGHETAQGYSRLFDAYLFLHRYEDAGAVADRGLALFPGDLFLLVKKARILSLTHDYRAAVAAWSVVEDQFPTVEETYQIGAFCRRQVNDDDGALRMLERGRALIPESIQIWLLHIEHLVSTEQWDEAYDIWARTSPEFPGDHRVPLLAARIEHKRNNIETARSFLQASIEANGGMPEQAHLDLQRELFS